MLFILPPSLRKEVRNKLKNKAYTQEEVAKLYHDVLEDYQNRLKAWKVICVIVIILMILLAALSMPQMSENSSIISILLITNIIIVCVLIYVRLMVVERVKRQFVKASKQGSYIL